MRIAVSGVAREGDKDEEDEDRSSSDCIATITAEIS